MEKRTQGATKAERVRLRLRIEGTVQGVGFRPHAHRLAAALELGGFVRNDGRGVHLEVEGRREHVRDFLVRIRSEAPPLARIEGVAVDEVPPADPVPGPPTFSIEASASGPSSRGRVSPDTATCEACLSELRDPEDRRFRHPFINCTDCGPRYTIVRALPYDRPNTTMTAFDMCAPCRAEYEDPADRRFHAQPNACPRCGPTVRFLDAEGRPIDRAGAADPVHAAALELRGGRIVALKGIGGFHLACRADDSAAVDRLRRRKRRKAKPFAVMVADLAAARALVEMDAEEERALTGPERPILLARRRPRGPLADAVAPGHRDLGVLLPYSPLHHLLLADAGVPLVMTSGNASDEPIASRNEDALIRLSGIADRYVVHDRPIEARADDSVVRVLTLDGRRRTMLLRRARGFVPPFEVLPEAGPRTVLACGGHLKSTFAVARGPHVWVGPHIGDLHGYDTWCAYRSAIEHFERVFGFDPDLAVHDLHPDYRSTRYAAERDLETLAVQHHHAHFAGCLAEHGEAGPAIGVVFDGTGYGPDGTAWGGELLRGDLRDFERVGHLRSVRMPGGEKAVREPWRMACAWLTEVEGDRPHRPPCLEGRVDRRRWEAVSALARSPTLSPATSSMGRLFDAVAVLSGRSPWAHYEGQAAIELEAVADPTEEGAYPVAVLGTDAGLILDPRETIRQVRDAIASGVPPARVSSRFHNGLARAVIDACERAAAESGLDRVVLTGGSFQNVRLAERASAGLLRRGLRVLLPQRLPPNDGGLAFGQAAVAAARMAVEGRTRRG